MRHIDLCFEHKNQEMGGHNDNPLSDIHDRANTISHTKTKQNIIFSHK